MAPHISLALAIHNHQPVGNFGWVFAEVFEQAYEPLVAALERHPGVRLSLHYTGPLLEWLRRERPEFIARLRALVEREQVELLGGGYYEPVLASLPHRDRVGQLRRMADELEAITGRRPRGAWLAERVWEPDLPTALVQGGYAWTILDDAHFRAASIPEEQLWGTYTTDDQGHLLTIFGTEQGLRYGIPFGRVEDVIAHLRANATEDGTRLGTMGDDGEKFGAWPSTWEHCWGQVRWVDRFFDALEENAGWLSTVTPSAWLDTRAPIGRVYVPTSSYAEMGQWALPADEAAEFADLFHRAVERKDPVARWLRGGFWRNFQVRYREINDLHKQMLRTSAKVAAMPAGPVRDLATDHLYQGQSNDCYWHGLFGGIYISHMRLATHEHLIAAEDLADAALGTLETTGLQDLDLDGIDEAFLATAGQVVTVKLDAGAGIGSWDVRPARHALAAVLRRRPEAYHERLRAHEASLALGTADVVGPAEVSATSEGHRQGEDGRRGEQPEDRRGAAAADPGAAEQQTVASIHDLVATKESNLSRHLRYDAWERRSALVRFLPAGTTAGDVAEGNDRELGDFVDGPFAVHELEDGRLVATRTGRVTDGPRSIAVSVEKAIRLGGDRRRPELHVELRVENRSGVLLETIVALEWNLTMLGGQNPAAWYEVDGERFAHDGCGTAGGGGTVAQGNDQIGLTLSSRTEPPAEIWWSPIETVSNSESGFERVYQGSSLLFAWRVRLSPAERFEARLAHAAETGRDLGTEETDGSQAQTR